MIFKRELAVLDLEGENMYITSMHGHIATIHFNDNKHKFWFDIIKNEKTIYNSSNNGILFSTLEEAQKDTKTWFESNINESSKSYSVSKKYSIALRAVKKICSENLDCKETNILKKVLKEIDEI